MGCCIGWCLPAADSPQHLAGEKRSRHWGCIMQAERLVAVGTSIVGMLLLLLLETVAAVAGLLLLCCW
jgi:hypothetical protein